MKPFFRLAYMLITIANLWQIYYFINKLGIQRNSIILETYFTVIIYEVLKQNITYMQMNKISDQFQNSTC